MLVSALGHRRFFPKYRFLPIAMPGSPFFFSRGSKLRARIRARLWIHSPKKGKGHAVHQRRDAKGTSRLISRNHQRIQTNTMMMLRFPTGVPKIPASRKKENSSRLGKTTANWNHRCRSSRSRGGNSRKASTRNPFATAGALLQAAEGVGSGLGLDLVPLIWPPLLPHLRLESGP